MNTKEILKDRLLATIERIHQACATVNRPSSSVVLLAATKTQGPEIVADYLTVASEAGVRSLIGENYVQEWRDKRALLSTVPPCHLIGPLQRNKAKEAVELFDCVQSVHSESIASALDSASRARSKSTNILLQINVSADDAKSGFTPELGSRFVRDVLPSMSSLVCRGLMAITRMYLDPEQARGDYRRLADLSRQLRSSIGPELSMGMSNDYVVAIEEGATIIRVGSAIFGERN